MTILKNTNLAFKKIRKTGWKLTIVILLIFFSAKPDYLSNIPFFYDAFLFSNNIYNYVADLISNVLDIFIVGDILGFIGSLLPFIAIYIVALTVISFIAVPVTNLIIKAVDNKKEKTPGSEKQRKEKKNNNSNKNTEKHVLGTTKLMSLFDKMKKNISLNELKDESQFVFFGNNETYLRVQRMNRNDSIGQSQKVEELLKWDSQNRISAQFTYKGKIKSVVVYLNQEEKAFVKMGEGIDDKEMEKNSPMGIWIPNKDGGQTLVMVITWIGDVFND